MVAPAGGHYGVPSWAALVSGRAGAWAGPKLTVLRLSRQLRAGLCGGFRLDPPGAVIRRVPAEHRDLFTTARHMNPYFVRPLGNVVDNPFSIGIRRDS